MIQLDEWALMNRTLWEIPVPVTSIIRDPVLKERTKRQCEIAFSFEAKTGEEKFETLVFEAVEALKCTYLTSLGSIDRDLRRQSYGSVISISKSPWLEELKKSYIKYCASAKLTPKDLQHLMITFDDGPCYEFICVTFRAAE
jgi:hypothetical protein